MNAEWQHITYNEFLPILLGPTFMDLYGLWPLNSGFSDDYRSDFDPRITNEFATAAFRVGHTLIPNLIHQLTRSGSGGRNLLRDMFFNIDVLRCDHFETSRFALLLKNSFEFEFELKNQLSTISFNFSPQKIRTSDGLDKLVRGMTRTPVETADDNFSEEITNFLFDAQVFKGN